MCFYFALDLGFCNTHPRDRSEVNHRKMSPSWPLSLILFLSCLCFLAEGKKKKTNKARHRNKWWLIETTNNEKGGEYGVDYQDDQDNDSTEPVCSSDKHGSVGLAIDTTS